MKRLVLALFATVFILFSITGVYLNNLSLADRQHLAVIAALEVGANDCEGGGGLFRPFFPAAARAYFTLPGVASSLIEDGGSFIRAGVLASAVCDPQDRHYPDNLARARESIDRGLKLGEPINRQWSESARYDGLTK